MIFILNPWLSNSKRDGVRTVLSKDLPWDFETSLFSLCVIIYIIHVLLTYLYFCNSVTSPKHIWAAAWQNQQETCAPSKDSDQPGHPPSLIRVFAVHMKNAWIHSYPLSAQQRLWSDWVDAEADLSLRWLQRSFCWFCDAAAQMCLLKVKTECTNG